MPAASQRQSNSINKPDEIWFTRCPVPTATGIAYKLGWLGEAFATHAAQAGALVVVNDIEEGLAKQVADARGNRRPAQPQSDRNGCSEVLRMLFDRGQKRLIDLLCATAAWH